MVDVTFSFDAPHRGCDVAGECLFGAGPGEGGTELIAGGLTSLLSEFGISREFAVSAPPGVGLPGPGVVVANTDRGGDRVPARHEPGTEQGDQPGAVLLGPERPSDVDTPPGTDRGPLQEELLPGVGTGHKPASVADTDDPVGTHPPARPFAFGDSSSCSLTAHISTADLFRLCSVLAPGWAVAAPRSWRDP
jgi:hypothetical protein